MGAAPARWLDAFAVDGDDLPDCLRFQIGNPAGVEDHPVQRRFTGLAAVDDSAPQGCSNSTVDCQRRGNFALPTTERY